LVVVPGTNATVIDAGDVELLLDDVELLLDDVELVDPQAAAPKATLARATAFTRRRHPGPLRSGSRYFGVP
jgi:hypothetical protein